LREHFGKAIDSNTRAEVCGKGIVRRLLVLSLLTAVTACQSSKGSALPISAAALSKQYVESRAEVRRKYDGQEIVIQGYSATAPAMPKPGEDQGSLLLTEKDGPIAGRVACWFSRDQASEFSRVQGGQPITVKGVFNGEAGVDLRFCKLVKPQ